MKKIILLLLIAVLAGCGREEKQHRLVYGKTIALGKSVLQDKIKGGWAGQTIGCTYGGPTEFKYKGGLINSQIPITWHDNYAEDTFMEDPGLYDDVYMDLTFMEVMAKQGIDAPAETYALAFANAGYKLWHANQAARYNILRGIMPPLSGHWTNNPHADDIDFQIESDFIGMICPGMVNTATGFADRIGHIMNYGDGWYGGVYMTAMYALAFVTDDIPFIVAEALKTIPQGTKFRNCLSEVIKYWKMYPNDWQQCWFEIEKRHGYDIGCPEGVFNGFNIDATINSAYVVIGLLYGEGDFFKTMDIATRCGQDSDCNPASAAGILGVIKGYEAIPDYWKPAMEKVEQMNFPYTTISLHTAYELTLQLIGEVLVKQGGKIEHDNYYVTLQQPEEVSYEVSFDGLYPVEKRVLKKKFRDVLTLKFNGNSVVLLGQITQTGEDEGHYVATLEASIDGKKVENFKMPYDYIKRKYDIFSIYNLPVDGAHELTVRVLNPHPNYVVEAKEMVVYATVPAVSVQPY
jgi:hypothetical protein